jgi:hypothetical protein
LDHWIFGARQLQPAIGSSRLAARLEQLSLMTQLYVGKNRYRKGIG